MQASSLTLQLVCGANDPGDICNNIPLLSAALLIACCPLFFVPSLHRDVLCRDKFVCGANGDMCVIHTQLLVFSLLINLNKLLLGLSRSGDSKPLLSPTSSCRKPNSHLKPPPFSSVGRPSRRWPSFATTSSFAPYSSHSRRPCADTLSAC